MEGDGEITLSDIESKENVFWDDDKEKFQSDGEPFEHEKEENKEVVVTTSNNESGDYADNWSDENEINRQMDDICIEFENENTVLELQEEFIGNLDEICIKEENTEPEVTPNENILSGRITQEPWPNDVKLFQPYEVEQILLPDNANCLAVQAFLKMCQLDFQVEPRPNAEAMSPSGKVPFIKAGAFVVAELEGIVQFVNNKGISLTENLDAEMKSDMRAYMSLIHNVIENAELYICWCDKETYNEVTSKRNGSIYPWPLNHIQNRAKRNAVIKKLKSLGWYNKTLPEVLQEVENCCQALTDRLEGKEYFFGSTPTELDALVFGHFYTILTTPLPTSQFAAAVKSYPLLIDLLKKIEKEYFKRETKH